MNGFENNRQVFILGASGFAAEVYSWLSSSLDDFSPSFVVGNSNPLVSPVPGVPCCHDKDLSGQNGYAFIAIGQPSLRLGLVERLKKETNLEFPNLIHKTSIVDPISSLGEGNLILPNTIICSRASLGSFNILNIYSSIGHEAVLEDYVTLSPYATLNGCSRCKSLSFLGTHSTVGPGITIGERASLSANSFANKEVPAGGLAFGVPAKVITRT